MVIVIYNIFISIHIWHCDVTNFIWIRSSRNTISKQETQPIIQPVTQPIIQPVTQPIIQPVIQAVTKPVLRNSEDGECDKCGLYFQRLALHYSRCRKRR